MRTILGCDKGRVTWDPRSHSQMASTAPLSLRFHVTKGDKSIPQTPGPSGPHGSGSTASGRSVPAAWLWVSRGDFLMLFYFLPSWDLNSGPTP
jgi:hypothetical protein